MSNPEILQIAKIMKLGCELNPKIKEAWLQLLLSNISSTQIAISPKYV